MQIVENNENSFTITVNKQERNVLFYSLMDIVCDSCFYFDRQEENCNNECSELRRIIEEYYIKLNKSKENNKEGNL